MVVEGAGRFYDVSVLIVNSVRSRIPSRATRTIRVVGIDALHLGLYRFSPMILAIHGYICVSLTCLLRLIDTLRSARIMIGHTMSSSVIPLILDTPLFHRPVSSVLDTHDTYN